MMSAKQLAQSALSRAGFYLSKTPPFSTQLRQFLDQQQVNLVLDVGAHHGGYCSFLRNDVGYRGPILSFEPCKASFEKLSERMNTDTNWRGFNFGLSDHDSTAVLNTYGDRSDFNSVLQLKDVATAAYGVHTKGEHETIQLKRLDTVWPDIVRVDRPRAYLKLDTQGHDLYAIKGAADRLGDIAGFQSEIPATQLYDGMPSMAEAIAEYAKLDFVPLGFFPVNITGSYGPLEFDVIFHRSYRAT